MSHNRRQTTAAETRKLAYRKQIARQHSCDKNHIWMEWWRNC